MDSQLHKYSLTYSRPTQPPIPQCIVHYNCVISKEECTHGECIERVNERQRETTKQTKRHRTTQLNNRT